MRTTLPLVCCLVLVLPAAPATAAETYLLHLDRNAPIAHRDRVTGTLRSQTQVNLQLNGQDINQNLDETFRFAVTTEVLATGAKGNTERAAIDVQELTREADGTTTPALASGTHVIGRIDKTEKIFEADGKRLPKALERVLAMIAPLRKDSDSDDVDFGTTERRAVGDTWPVNAEAMAKHSTEFRFAPRNLTGSVRLISLKPCGTASCAEVQIGFEVQKIATDLEGPVKLKDGVLKMSTTRVLPVNSAVGFQSDTTRLDMEVTVGPADNGTVASGNIHTLLIFDAKAVPVQ
jgi:hypothetical protein